MEIKLDVPADVFDDTLRVEDFTARIRELALLELVRLKRMHEHEAQRLLGIERWELVERMTQVGITSTELVFDKIRGELDTAIKARKASQRSTGVKEK